MPSCALTGGISQTACPLPSSGAYHNRIWLATLSEINTFYAGSVANEYNLIDFVGSNGLFACTVHKDSVTWSETKAEDSDSYDQQLEFRLVDHSITARNWAESLLGVDIVAIVELKAGVFKIIGKDSGGRLALDNATSAEDGNGRTMTIKANMMPEPCPHFWNTDEATTLAKLASYEVTT